MAPNEPAEGIDISNTTCPTTRSINDTSTHYLAPSEFHQLQVRKIRELDRKETHRRFIKHKATCARNKKKRKKRRK